MLHLRPLDAAASSITSGTERSRRAFGQLRPGAILALSVVSVVGVTGLVQWDQRLIVIGFVAGLVIIALNIIGVTTYHWHQRNTKLETSYGTAEEAVRYWSPEKR